ncbi:MAG: hypothetical protein J6S14_22045 [Clostridia bacterium]|nr:hypothetical protein [Clostridia bacterium]
MAVEQYNLVVEDAALEQEILDYLWDTASQTYRPLRLVVGKKTYITQAAPDTANYAKWDLNDNSGQYVYLDMSSEPLAWSVYLDPDTFDPETDMVAVYFDDVSFSDSFDTAMQYYLAQHNGGNDGA